MPQKNFVSRGYLNKLSYKETCLLSECDDFIIESLNTRTLNVLFFPFSKKQNEQTHYY